jgi:hypothetical protein
MDLHKANGRIDFVEIEKADDRHITFAANQAGSDRRVTGELAVSREKSAQIERLNFIGLKPQWLSRSRR